MTLNLIIKSDFFPVIANYDQKLPYRNMAGAIAKVDIIASVVNMMGYGSESPEQDTPIITRWVFFYSATNKSYAYILPTDVKKRKSMFEYSNNGSSLSKDGNYSKNYISKLYLLHNAVNAFIGVAKMC